jgi:2-phosphosulfolactate phosphatase
MKFKKESLQTCSQATGLVVVIDVIRAFTTAAFAFAEGAKTITLVGTVEEALFLRNQNPNTLVMGEVKGLPPDGFDFGNSPTELLGAEIKNCHVIQRTSRGTQGVVNSYNAEALLAASFCNAHATVNHIKRIDPESVTFVITGLGPDGRGEEDMACAEYLESLLSGTNVNPKPYLTRVLESRTSQALFANPEMTKFLWQDIEYCVDLDRFDFAMVVSRKNGQYVMKPINLRSV